MPVENAGNFFPKPANNVKQPEGPVSVEFDDGLSRDEKDMVDLGEATTVDHSELHTPGSTDAFEVPGPVSVVVEGYGVKGETTSPQVKLVESKPRGKGKGTSGAETK
jgi:hypothetical protein